MAKKIFGGQCKVYKAAALFAAVPGPTAYATGTFTEMSTVVEVSLDDSKEEADASDRTSMVDKKYMIGRTVKIDVTIHQNPDDPNYMAFVNAYNNDISLPLMFTSSDKTGTTRAVEGFSANFQVGTKKRGEKRKEVNAVTFSLSVEDFYGDFVVAGS